MKIEKEKLLFTNKALFLLIVPLIIEQFLAVIVGMVDSMVVARAGEAAVSGVSLVDQVMILMINGFGALATGGAVVAGQYLGRKEKEKGSKASSQLIYFILISSLVITLIVYLLKPFIIHVLFGKIDAEVASHAGIYFDIVAASIPFIAMYNGGAAIFRTMGNSGVTMKIAVLMNIINVVGDFALVYGLGMGTAGVAIPTLVSRAVAAVIIIILLLDQKRLLHIAKTIKIKLDFGMVRRILRIGIPNGLESSMFQVGKIVVLGLVSSFGTYAIAANAVSNVLALLQILPGIALGLAATAVISRCIGAGDYEQVKYYNRKIIIIAHIAIGFMSLVTYLLLPVFMKIYGLSPEAEVEVIKIITLHSIGCTLIWPESFVLPSSLRATGDANITMYISTFSMWAFRIGSAFLLAKFFGIGVSAVWIAMMIDWTFRAIMFIIRYYSGKWKNKAVV